MDKIADRSQSKRLVQNFIQLETSRLLHYCRSKVWPNWALSSNSSSWSASALYLPEPPGQKDTLFKSHNISPVWFGKNQHWKFFLLQRKLQTAWSTRASRCCFGKPTHLGQEAENLDQLLPWSSPWKWKGDLAHKQRQQQEPDVAHEWLVLGPSHVLLLPASVAEVVEAGEVPGQEIRRGEGFEADLILSEAHPLCLNKCNFVHRTSKSIKSMVINLQKYGPCFMLHNEHKVS